MFLKKNVKIKSSRKVDGRARHGLNSCGVTDSEMTGKKSGRIS